MNGTCLHAEELGTRWFRHLILAQRPYQSLLGPPGVTYRKSKADMTRRLYKYSVVVGLNLAHAIVRA